MHRDALNTAEDFGANTVSPWVELEEQSLGGFGVFVTFSASGRWLYAGAANGGIRFWSAHTDVEGSVQLGASPLCASPAGAEDLLIGTDSGCLMRLSPDGGLEVFHEAGPGWVEQVTTGADGVVAIAVGRTVKVLDADGTLRRNLGPQPSTPTGLSLDRGSGRLAVSHYDGVTVWDLESGEKEMGLEWHGSHTLMSWSPDGRHIATATQDKELHAWRMPEGHSLKMSGYPGKIRSLSWTPDGAYLVCAGADTITCWRFADGGPGGTAPLEFGYVFNALVTQVAAHPRRPFVAGGYENGSVLVGALATSDAIIARPGNGEPITAMAWSALTDTLAAVGALGTLSVMHLSEGAFE